MSKDKHYELTTNKKIVNKVELTQIYSKIDIPKFGVKIGDRGGWISEKVIITNGCWLPKAVIALGGEFHGGEFYGGNFYGNGEFYGGRFYGGNFHYGNFSGGGFLSGEFLGGHFAGGHFTGGRFEGGRFEGGFFYGGHFRYGKFYNGYFYGGEFIDGDFHAGSFYNGCRYENSPFFIQLHKGCIAECGDGTLKIGCKRLSAELWLEKGEEIAKRNGYNNKDIFIYKQAIKFAANYMKANKQNKHSS